MIASPGDVAEERTIVTEQVHRWNSANATARQIVLLPVKWETNSTPQLGAPPQTIINKQLLDDADIMIGIFGTRIGTPTEEYVSGSVEEIKKHVAAGKTAKVYFSDVPVPPSKVDPEQYASVNKFREECQSTGLYASYSNFEQFRTDFSHHLDLEMNQPRYRWLSTLAPVTEDSEATLSEDAIHLLRTAASSDGRVIYKDGFGVMVKGKDFTDGTPRSAAQWQGALEELMNSGAMEHASGAIYRVTANGYRTADKTTSQNQNTASFNDLQKNHLRDLLQPLTYIQRDLLRFLLLKGGSVRGDVIASASPHGVGMDWNALTQSLKLNGLLIQTDDHRTGYSTYAVSATMIDALKSLLFPRDEGNGTPFFRGIPTAK